MPAHADEDGGDGGNGYRPRPFRRILVVEDHDDIAQALARLLKLDGHTVQVAATLAQAKHFCDTETFDVVLCDLGLPDGNGLDLAHHARAARPGVKLIAVTGSSMPEDLRAIQDAGFDGQVIKPFVHAALTPYLA